MLEFTLMNIFIDTSIVIQENYLSGIKLKRLAVLSNQGFVKLFFTNIVDNEIFSNISSESEKLIQAEKTFTRQLETKHRIAKNLYDFENLTFVSNSYFQFEERMKEKFERFKEFSKIEIIFPKESFDISKLIDDYFKINPPFGLNNKKNEFPDAISFMIAEDYLNSIDAKGFYLTNDSDFNEIKSNFLTVKNDISDVLEEITKENNSEYFVTETQILKCIQTDIHLFIPGIASEVELDVMIHHEMLFEKYGMQISNESQYAKEISITDFEIFDITEDSIGFKCIGTYVCDIHYLLHEDFSFETHNRVIELEKIILQNDGLVTYQGDFETTIYYNFEFPFQVIPQSIEIDEEKSIKSIKSI